MLRLAGTLAHPESCKGFEMSHCGVGFAHQPWARRLVSVGEAHPPWTHGNVVGWASPTDFAQRRREFTVGRIVNPSNQCGDDGGAAK